MKKKLLFCQNCNEETWHLVGKKEATSRSSSYVKRSTSQCTKCGEKEINNKKTGRRKLKGRNKQ